MTKENGKQFSEAVSVFQERRLPEKAKPAGYAALIDAYNLAVPLPIKLSAIGTRHKVYEEDNWHIYTPRHMPDATLEGHLVFALKYEGLDLAVLKRFFEAVSPEIIENIVKAKPTSSYARRLWFLYEWLLNRKLSLLDAKTGTYAEVVDTTQQWAISGVTSTRHRVRNNLPGTRDFCPLVFRTPIIEQSMKANLSERARQTVSKLSADILARTAAFLLLKDSKSSYAIEGEAPPQNRIQRWGRAIGEAGRRPLDLDELLRLQRIVIGDSRFIKLGLRQEGGFVGEHEHGSRLPLPEHISARPEDLPELVQGLLDFDRRFSGELDAVLAAAMLAFGFVYIHPFEDGNGRIHRYLIHHVLAKKQFAQQGIIFPVSASILDHIDDYRKTLESYSHPLLDFIEWKETHDHNVEVTNNTLDYYRYYDTTRQAEFLYDCVKDTIENIIPNEVTYLGRYDAFKKYLEDEYEMPDSLVAQAVLFLQQNNGRLSKRAKEKEFSKLIENEILDIEEKYRELFLTD